MDENKKPAPPNFLTRGEILARTRLTSETVKVPEWGGSVVVRELTGAERDKYEASLVRMQDNNSPDLVMDNARARLVSLSVIDPDGSRIFTDADVQALGNLSAAALSRVFDVAARLSKISSDDLKELSGN